MPRTKVKTQKKKRKTKNKKPGRKLIMTKRLRIPRKDTEEFLISQGYKNVAGLDEVGRGAMAGPLVAAAVILADGRINKIRDSKLLTHKERVKLAKKIKKKAHFWAISEVPAATINRIGLQKSQYLAWRRAVGKLGVRPNFILIDGPIPHNAIPYFPQKLRSGGLRGVIKGDMKVSSIAAASIIAKTYRDKLMSRLTYKFKRHYSFNRHKGYSTRLHKAQIKKWGICKEHRLMYKPVKRVIKSKKSRGSSVR